MTSPIELVLASRPSEIARLQDRLETLAREQAIPQKALHEVQLAVEEHLTNVLHHGYGDQAEHQMLVRLHVEAGSLRIEIEDDGRSFNPLEHPQPNLSLPLDQRPIGGLGIHMMRESVDRMEYRRVDGKNILIMLKHFKAPAP
jgi:anti-sigma regulatory factor (Ser/Thr protein kinase)